MNFYLSESYADADIEEVRSYVKGIMNNATMYKPQGVKFVLEIIDTINDFNYQESAYDRMMKQMEDEY